MACYSAHYSVRRLNSVSNYSLLSSVELISRVFIFIVCICLPFGFSALGRYFCNFSHWTWLLQLDGLQAIFPRLKTSGTACNRDSYFKRTSEPVTCYGSNSNAQLISFSHHDKYKTSLGKGSTIKKKYLEKL